MVLTLGDEKEYFFCVLAAMVYCLALLPTAMAATSTPQPLTSVSLDLRGLWKNSPISFFGVLMLGVSNAAFVTLAAVYAARTGLPLGDSPVHKHPYFGGSGIASDQFDRRIILIVIGLIALVADVVFLFGGFADPLILMGLAGIFGAMIYSMYPVIVAHANDRAAPGTFIQVSGGLLLVYGVGSAVGPAIAGFAMSRYGAPSLFAVTGAAHVLLILFSLLRLRSTTAVEQGDKDSSSSIPVVLVSTPETAALAANEEEFYLDREKNSASDQSVPTKADIP